MNEPTPTTKDIDDPGRGRPHPNSTGVADDGSAGPDDANTSDLTPLAVPYTLARLRPLLPPPPARLVEVGCGSGALAAALAGLGYRVTGVDVNPDACAAAAARGVEVICSDVTDVPVRGAGFDAVLFTRSLHAIADLAAAVGHALDLVVPGGAVVLEDFARERADAASAGFVYDSRALLTAAGVLRPPAGVATADPDEDPDQDPVARWEGERGTTSPRPVHTGVAMVAALTAAGASVESTADTETLWRLVSPRGWRWTLPSEQVEPLLRDLRRVECRRIAEGSLRAVGLLATARRRP